MGYSDPGPSPRTVRRIASELATLIDRSGIDGRLVLVGASSGGFNVRVYDSLSEQVHPTGIPDYLAGDIELVRGDVRDMETLRDALRGVDVVYHFAAAVGVGQDRPQAHGAGVRVRLIVHEVDPTLVREPVLVGQPEDDRQLGLAIN